MGHPTPIFGRRSKFSDYLYKADPDHKSPGGGQYTGPFSWENRPFTIEELKRLQTFPDDYVIEGNRQAVIHQLGNSVPPQLARILALSILEQVFNAHLPFAISSMPDSYQLGFRKRKGELTALYAQKAAQGIAKNSPSTVSHQPAITAVEFFSLTSDLRIRTDLTEDTSDHTAEFSLNEHAWIIRLSETHSTSDAVNYEIRVTPPTPIGLANSKTLASVTLLSGSHDPKSLLALWKIFEFLVQRHRSKDDLVQLFGYYQYKLAYSIDMTIRDQSLLSGPFWQTVKAVTAGSGVGVITPISELSAREGIVESWDAKYGKSYLREEIEEALEKIPEHDNIQIVGFVTNVAIQRTAELDRRINELSDLHAVDFKIISYEEWVGLMHQRCIDSSLIDEETLSREWLKAYVLTLSQRKRAIAPVDEPCMEWIRLLRTEIERT